uniref:Uncharacterized protein n=1 Tax=Ciona intestinalis TaxID=7719 RepID=F6WKX8_CIOIN
MNNKFVLLLVLIAVSQLVSADVQWYSAISRRRRGNTRRRQNIYEQMKIEAAALEDIADMNDVLQ